MHCYILFSRPKRTSLLSLAVRWFTWSWASHVEIMTADGYIVGAQLDDGVVCLDEPNPDREYRPYFVEVTDHTYNKIDQFLFKQLGKPYDYTAILGFLFRRNWQEPSSWFCSELVAAALAAGGIRVVRERAWRVTPRDLMISPALQPASWSMFMQDYNRAAAIRKSHNK